MPVTYREGTVSRAERMSAALSRPDPIVNVPATPEGIPAIRWLTAQGVHASATLALTLDICRDVRTACVCGLGEMERSAAA